MSWINIIVNENFTFNQDSNKF